jgi:hypothetical protein
MSLFYEGPNFCPQWPNFLVDLTEKFCHELETLFFIPKSLHDTCQTGKRLIVYDTTIAQNCYLKTLFAGESSLIRDSTSSMGTGSYSALVNSRARKDSTSSTGSHTTSFVRSRTSKDSLAPVGNYSASLTRTSKDSISSTGSHASHIRDSANKDSTSNIGSYITHESSRESKDSTSSIGSQRSRTSIGSCDSGYVSTHPHEKSSSCDNKSGSQQLRALTRKANFNKSSLLHTL